MSCCSAKNHAGMGTGTFCGSLFTSLQCGDDLPVCCTSLSAGSKCCPAGSSCSSGCHTGSHCRCVLPPEDSLAQKLYDEKKALAFGQLALAAYCGHERAPPLLQWSCPLCTSAGMELVPGSMRFIDRPDGHTQHALFAFVAQLEVEDSLACVVVFRGTARLANWKRNIQAMNLSMSKAFSNEFDCRGCGIHKGFAAIYRGLRFGEDGVEKNLESLGCGPNSGREIFVAGHSMGAAVATLAMYSLSHRGFKLGRSYLFMSPRLGNRVFAESFSSQLGEVPLFRITHNKDPIIRLPSRNFGWRHVGSEAYYGEHWNNSFVVCETSEDHKCSRRFWILDDLFSFTSVMDHCSFPLLGGRASFCVWPDFCPALATV